MIPPGHSINAQLAQFEDELRAQHREALASEGTRAAVEKQIADALAQRELELIASAQLWGGLPVTW